MKTGFKYLILLSIICFSCFDNEVLISDSALDSSQTLEEIAGESSIVVSNLLSDMIKLMSLSPEVEFGSEEHIAQVRNGCPTTLLQSDGIYPDTFFIDFSNCDPSAVFEQRYNGSLVFILNGAFDNPDVCPLFSIKNSPVNPEFFLRPDNRNGRSYEVAIDNDVDFCLQSVGDGSFKYTYTLDGEIVLDFRNGNTTTYPDAMEGCVTLKNNNKDDLTKPATLIDNTYCVSAKPTIIECERTDGTIERFCIATNPEGIRYNLRCGCPEAGRLYIDSPANGNCNSIIGTSSFWDYGFIQNPGVGSCENSALDPDNIVTRIPCGHSF